MRTRISLFTTIIILLAGVIFSACKNKQPDQQAPVILAGDQYISALIDSQLSKSVEDGERIYTSGSPYIYFYATHSLDSVRTAFVIYNTIDSTATAQWYRLETGQWKLRDSITGLPEGKIPVSAVVEDYNFDGQPDLYLQETTASENKLVYGRLFTIDASTKKLTEHPDLRQMGNLHADKPTKSIVSMSMKSLGNDLPPSPCDVISKWKNGKLITISKLCECD